MSIVIPPPFDTPSSISVVLGQCLLVYTVASEATRTPPPGIARLWFLLGVMLWNAYALVDPAFPFVDNWSVDRDPDIASLTEAERTTRFSFLLYLVWNTIIATFMPSLPTLQSAGIVVVTTPPTDYYAALQAHNVFATYVAERSTDGYTAASDPSYVYPNKGYYIKVYQDPTGQPVQNLTTDLPDPTTWCPLEVHYTNGTVTRQKPVLPAFGAVLNWFSSAQLTDMNGIASSLYPPQSSSLFQLQKRSFVEIQSSLTDTDKVNAEVWAGTEPAKTTPPGKWFVFIAVVLMSQGSRYRAREAVAMFSGLSFAIFHAAISAWTVKYTFLQPRPIQTIRQDYFTGYVTNPVTGNVVPGGIWVPYQQFQETNTGGSVTPAFPDYVSGHSVFSMAAATFLQMLTGTDTVPVNNTDMIDPVQVLHPIAHIFDPLTRPCTWVNILVPPMAAKTAPNVPINAVPQVWTSWTTIAQTVGMSRVWGGIHWMQSNYAGLQLGEWVGLKMHEMIDFSSLGLDFPLS